MKEQAEIEQIVTRHLLGESSLEDERLIEERSASDPNFLDLVLAAEDDLIDAYVKDQLSSSQREWFQRTFLASPENRDRVEFAAVLMKQLDEESAVAFAPATWKRASSFPPRPVLWIQSFIGSLRVSSFALQLALGAILLAVLCGGLWLLIENSGPRQQSGQTREKVAERQNEVRQSSRGGQLPQNDQAPNTNAVEPTAHVSNREAEAAPKPVSPGKPIKNPVVASFVLTPGLTRAASETNKIEIPKNAHVIKLQLSIDSSGNYRSYHASLRQVGGGEIWSQAIKNNRLESDGKPKALKSITLRVPTNLLSDGEYLLMLTGITPTGEDEVAGDYAFTVSEKR